MPNRKHQGGSKKPLQSTINSKTIRSAATLRRCADLYDIGEHREKDKMDRSRSLMTGAIGRIIARPVKGKSIRPKKA